MYRPFVFVAFLLALIHCNVSQQIQMPESSALVLPDEELITQVQTLQRNVSELWSYIYQLRGAVSQHLNHLRQHQVELEDIVHRMSHHHDGHNDATHADHTAGHSHSGEQHSHSGEQHSHGGDSHSGDSHSHGGDSHSHGGDSHSHGGDSHSHGGDSHSHGSDSHSHSGEHHSHGSDQHSHSGEHHSHGGYSHSHSSEDHSHGSHGHYHDSHSHSHSHSGDDHGAHSSHESGDSHHDHKDSHETEDDLQQTQQGADLQQVSQGTGPVLEPVVVATQARPHDSHHSHGSHSSSSSGSSSSSSGSSSSFQPLPLMHDYHHHHHENEPRRNRSRIVVMPKYSEYNLYEFAVCNVQPNRAIPLESQQEIVGQISLWQKKIGGPLNIHVRVQGFSMGDHHDHQQVAQQEEDNETPAAGHKHGFHIHTSGDLSNGCQSTGSHYNPKNVNHGGPSALVRHVGDLGNIECDEHGVANIVFSDGVASLRGQYSVVGRAIVIHSQVDDLGLGGNDESLRTGNAGTRLACCVIEKVDKLPIRSYKAIKTASQYQN